MVNLMKENSEVNKKILDNKKYDLIFSVEEVNRLAAEGVPFRDAYKKVGLEIEAGNFHTDKVVNHTHEGSIGNLCNESLQLLMQQTIDSFDFEKADDAEKKLLDK